MKRTVFLLLTFHVLIVCCLGQEEKLPKSKPIIDLEAGAPIGKAIYLAKPPFPSCNCKYSKVNKASIRFVVNEEGRVESAEPISGHPLLKAAGVAAIRASRFSVSRFGGDPVKAYGVITYEFRIMRTRSKVSVLDYNLKLQKSE